MHKDLSEKLPARITAVQPQKKNRERYSLFIDEGFLIGVSESTLLEHRLSKGTEVTPSLLEKLRKAEGRHAVKSYCLGILARRDHSRKELYDKAAKKDHPRDIINSVLDELEKKGFLDDRSFARKFASDKSRYKNWGPGKIKAHLFKKGISRSVAEESIEAAFRQLDMGKIFHDLVFKNRRRFLREQDPLKRKKKIFDYLRRKGYRSESIMNHVDDLLESVDS